MVGAHFHCRTFLLTVFLYFCLLRHTYELGITEMKDDLEILCGENKSLDSASPARDSHHIGNETHYFKEIPAQNRLSVESRITPKKIVFVNCRPPNKPYLEILKDSNINPLRVSTIDFKNMTDADLLNESLFEGISLKNMTIQNDGVYIEYHGKLDLANVFQHTMRCENKQGRLINKTPFFSNRLLNVTHVIFNDCKPPNVSYYEILRKLNIRPSSVQELSLWALHTVSTNLKPDNFKLSVPKLSVSCAHGSVCELDDVFEEVEANELYLHGIELTTLNNFTAKKVTMEYGRSSGEWGNCSTLTSLELIDVTVTTAGWLRHCGNLKDLTLRSLSNKEVERTLSGAITHTVPFFFGNFQTDFKEAFAVAVNIRRLKIEGSLDHIKSDTFSEMNKLEELDISDNNLGGEMFYGFTPLQNLRKLSADRNMLHDFCDVYQLWGVCTTIRTAENVSFKNSNFTEICFKNWINLSYLDLSHNLIISLQLRELPAPQNHTLTVDLRGNPLETLTENFHYENTVTQFKGSNNITILLNWTVECDCEHTSFVRMLRELPQISLENVTCTSGERLVDFAGEKFGCHKYSCHKCTCRTAENGTTVAYCNSKNLNAFPAVWQFLEKNSSKEIVLKKIVVSENVIEMLPENDTYYPISLDEIDLRNNTIMHIPVKVLNALFFGGKRPRRVYLSGNPFECSCETERMLYFLRKHSNKVPDYNNLKCITGKKSYFRNITLASLCPGKEVDLLPVLVAVAASLLALTTIMTLLVNRFKLTIKAFLYARGLCLFWVREDELDADKEYDAFISFAHSDNELVDNTLLPGLQNDYSICVHTRNWMPGEWIHTQIVQSVNQSRRTIIVLSKKFVESLWGMTEFRTAYINSLQEGRVRVICIVVDDVIDEMELEPDLKAYLKSNTYLKWNDPFFWQKLRYAMPHPRDEQSEVQNGNEEMEWN